MFLIIEKVLVKAILSSSSMPHVGSKVEYLSVPFFKKKLGFTPCKAEQLLQSMELQEKEAKKD